MKSFSFAVVIAIAALFSAFFIGYKSDCTPGAFAYFVILNFLCTQHGNLYDTELLRQVKKMFIAFGEFDFVLESL